MFAVKEGVSAGSLFRWARLHRSMASSSRAVELVEAVPLETTEAGSWAGRSSCRAAPSAVATTSTRTACTRSSRRC